jgi:hypothetical protein
MTTTPTPSTTADNLNHAIETYSNDALQLYDDSEAGAHVQLGPNATDKEKADLKAAQGQHAGAFSQLATAASMDSDQRSRDGFAAVVRLMQTTADAADNVSRKLVDVLHAGPNDTASPAAADYQLIASLTEALHVLAELSPSQVWTGTSQSSGS